MKNESTPTPNRERALRAEGALAVYASTVGREDELTGSNHAATLITDLLADFMHLADHFDIDFQNCLDVARMHFDAEAAEAAAGRGA